MKSGSCFKHKIDFLSAKALTEILRSTFLKGFQDLVPTLRFLGATKMTPKAGSLLQKH